MLSRTQIIFTIGLGAVLISSDSCGYFLCYPHDLKPGDYSICFCQVVQTPFQSDGSQCPKAASLCCSVLYQEMTIVEGRCEVVTKRS